MTASGPPPDPRRSPLLDAAEYGLVQTLLAPLRWLPLPQAEGLARVYTGLLRRVVPRLSRVARGNLQMAGLNPSLEDGAWQSVARLMVAFARPPRQHAYPIEHEGLEHVDAALARGRGMIVATAHLGNWELDSFAPVLAKARAHVLIRPLANPLLARHIRRRRQQMGFGVIERFSAAARTALRALHRNEIVVMFVDQNTSAREGVFVDFFGVPACASTGAARLSASTGAALVPAFALFDPETGRYRLRFFPALPVTGDTAADTQRLHALLETVIRAHPDQWLWMHRRWKTRPAGAPPP